MGTIGLPGSASTWVFNVVRELMIAHYGAAQVYSAFSDGLQRVLEDPEASGRHIVWKLHCPDKGWRLLAALARARVILTVRDPRDAMLSVMQRFDYSLTAACGTMRRSMQSVAESVADGHILLRYEDRFFDRPATVAQLARHLGIALAESEMVRIFELYATEAVRALGRRLDDLPVQLKTTDEFTCYDPVTQIHRNHIGDQQIGKWRHQFDRGQRETITALLTPWLQALGYDPA